MRFLSPIGIALTFALTVIACSREDDPRATVEDAASAAASTLNAASAIGPTLVLDRMVAHARSGDWAGYVDFYGESDKLRSPADREALVRRFEREWGAEVLSALERAHGVTPVLEGNRAVFRDGSGDAFVLYLDENGHWGFHL